MVQLFKHLHSGQQKGSLLGLLTVSSVASLQKWGASWSQQSHARDDRGKLQHGRAKQRMAKAHQARDWKDTHIVLNYLQERNPFTSDTILRSISTGVHAHNSVNVDKGKDVGNAILVRMEGKTAAEYSFKRNKQAVTLDTKSAVKIDGIAVQIDPRLLFQRLTIAARANDNLEDVFKYELCSYLPALFDSPQSHRSQCWPTLSGPSWHLALLRQLVRSSMCWMVVHSFSASHGHEWQHTERYALCT